MPQTQPHSVYRRLFNTLTCAAALTLCAGMASAGCKYGVCWNALAIGPDGRAGYASDRDIAPDAVNLALEACGKECTTVQVFDGGCGALAESKEGTAHLGLAATRDKAQEDALEQCGILGTSCTMRVSICSRD